MVPEGPDHVRLRSKDRVPRLLALCPELDGICCRLPAPVLRMVSQVTRCYSHSTAGLSGRPSHFQLPRFRFRFRFRLLQFYPVIVLPTVLLLPLVTFRLR